LGEDAERIAVRGIYFGWYVVVAAIAIYTVLLGSTFASFGLYILPVSEEFGLSRADINTGLIALNLGNAALAPVIGRFIDRFSARKLMMTCAALIGASMAAISQTDMLLLSLVLIFFAVSAGVLGGGTISGSVLLARWFKVYRGRAMALAALGFSLGGVVGAPIIGELIEQHGWRTAVLVSGVGTAAIVFLLAFFMRDRPGPGDIEVREQKPSQETTAEPAEDSAAPPLGPPPGMMTFLRMPLFWMLALGIGLASGISQGLTVSLVPLGHEAGLTTMQGAMLISVSGITGLVSMLALAAWGDRVDRTLLLALVIVSITISCALLLVAKSYVALLVTAGIIGFSLSVFAPIYIALFADRFGLAGFGTVRGLLVPVMSLFGALSVRFIGEIYDRTGGYVAGLWTYLVLVLLAAGMVLASRRMSSGMV
jgi:MFS family permease